MSIHTQIIEMAGKKEFVVIPYDEFLRVQEALENYEDLPALRNEKADAHAEHKRYPKLISAEAVKLHLACQVFRYNKLRLNR